MPWASISIHHSPVHLTPEAENKKKVGGYVDVME
jgi:hypothetical protein